MKSNPAGIIFATQRMSVHDGPGWRTLVFLKGCPLRCKWCANPESWTRTPELAYVESRCLGVVECGRCISECPESAILEVKKGGTIRIDRKRCNNCGDCVNSCPTDAVYLFGQSITVEGIIQTVEEDSIFYARSQGGLTLGGGEPLFQPDFASALLQRCSEQGIHTCIETCGAVPWVSMEHVCRYVDMIHYDIKSANEKKHKAFTGVGNRQILNNLELLAEHFPDTPITVRTPVIPGFNDTRADIENIVQIVGNNPSVTHYELLPYHRFGSQKYTYIGKKFTLGDIKPPSAKKVRELYTAIPQYFRPARD